MQALNLSQLLSKPGNRPARRLELFALLTMGVVESLASGALSSGDATRQFFNAENCLYVRKKLRDKTADRIMSHGVQLQDLFEALPSREAQQEFQRELGTMRALCLQLVEGHALVA